MRLTIRHHIAVLVAVCSLGGLALSSGLAWSLHSLEQHIRELGLNPVMLNTADRLKRETNAWLLAVEAALSSTTQARQDALSTGHDLSELIESLRECSIPEGCREELDSMQGYVASLQDRIRLQEWGGGRLAERRRKLGEEIDALAPLLLDALGEVDEAVQVHAFRASQEVADKQRTLAWASWLSGLGYVVLVMGIWRWTSQTLIRPIQTLTKKARQALAEDNPLRLEPNGPTEVRALTNSLSSLVDTLQGARDRLEEKVRERTVELERANSAKSEFLANMSHEIRTPMTAILGYADLMRDPALPEEERRRYLETICFNGQHLLEIINDILDISKIEARRLVVGPKFCSPFDIVGELVSLMRVRAGDKGLDLKLVFDGPLPEKVRTDPTRLRQILLNLVGNAIKFTAEGEVRLTARMQLDPRSNRELLAFEVQDTGEGMDAEELARIFRPFIQLDSTASRKHGGTGLGLTISKALAEMLGGGITVVSEPHRGSTFTACVDPGPLDGVRRIAGSAEHDRPPRAALPARKHAPRLAGRVLLVEDVEVNRRLIALLLERAGLTVDQAENGRAAFTKAMQAHAEGQPFDIVFMDMQMPVMNGYEATQALRTAGYAGKIVALTAHSMREDRDRCLAAGCDDYATKPIDRDKLLEIASRLLELDGPLLSDASASLSWMDEAS